MPELIEYELNDFATYKHKRISALPKMGRLKNSDIDNDQFTENTTYQIIT